MNVKCVLDSFNLDQIRTDLATHYHLEGPGRKPLNPLSMFKAQLAKHLLRIISDRRLALRLRNDHKVAKACGFRRQTPSHGLFTHFRHRLGEETYQRIFNELTKMLIESGSMIGKVVAVDSTHLAAYSGRAMDNATGRSDPDARVGRGRRGFILGYKTNCSGDWNSELPTAYLVAPANENEKRHFKEVASKARERFPNAKWHVADNQYSSKRLRKYIEEELKGRPVIPKRRDEKRGAGGFYMDRSFRCRGNRRMCGLYGRRTASERVNSRAERLIGRNTLRGLSRVGGYVGVALTLMLLIAAASYRRGRPELARSIGYYASH